MIAWLCFNPKLFQNVKHESEIETLLDCNVIDITNEASRLIQTLYVFRFSFTRNISTLSFDNAPSEQSLGVELVHPKPKELLIVFFSFQPFTFEQ